MIQALKMALRGLRKDVTTSVAAVAMLGLGLASSATFFSLLWGGGLRHLPVPEGDRVVRIEGYDPAQGGTIDFEWSDLDVLGRLAAFEGVGAFASGRVTLSLQGSGPVRATIASATPSVFRLLDVPPALGRIPLDSEVTSTLVIGHDLWVREFDRDPSVVGRVVDVDGVAHTVAAVMPDGFRFPFRQDAWLPVDPNGSAPVTELEIVARLASGSEPGVAEAQVSSIWSSIRPDETVDARAVFRVRPFTRGRGGAGERVAFLGLVMVGVCLLVIACVNAANLLLVRATERLGVMGVQSALGASRFQIASQLLLEALVLAGLGGLAGLAMAHAMVGYIQDVMAPENFGYYWMRVEIDAPVVAFTGILVLGTALLAGSLPVVRVMRVDLQGFLKAGGGRSPGGVGGWSWGRVFVTGQLALSCFALVAAGLTAGAMRRAARIGSGLPADEIVIASYMLDGARFSTAEARRETWASLDVALDALAGGEPHAVALGAPAYGERRSPLAIVGGTSLDLEAGERVAVNAVTPSFHSLFDLDLLRGRALSPRDRIDTEPVAVVNESFVERFALRADPIGLEVRLPAIDSTRVFRVVGVVADADVGGGSLAREDAVYLPLDQVDAASAVVLVRGATTSELFGEVRRVVAAWDPHLPAEDVRTLEGAYDYMTRAQSTLSLLAVSGGFAGLFVASVGLYALLAFRVRRTRREMGVRLALGADAARLARDVMAFALGQLLPAVVVGLALAWLAAPALGLLLLGGNPRSVGVYGSVAAAFVLIGLGAALVPSLRAASVDPAEAMRSD